METLGQLPEHEAQSELALSLPVVCRMTEIAPLQAVSSGCSLAGVCSEHFLGDQGRPMKLHF